MGWSMRRRVGPAPRSAAEFMQRTTFLKLRVSTDEVECFNARAASLNVSVSQLIRDTALRGGAGVGIKVKGESKNQSVLSRGALLAGR